jgi:DNA-binding response OmpR family regulator
LLNEVWGFDFPTTANSLEVYIGYLRHKTEAGDESRLIHTYAAWATCCARHHPDQGCPSTS